MPITEQYPHPKETPHYFDKTLTYHHYRRVRTLMIFGDSTYEVSPPPRIPYTCYRVFTIKKFWGLSETKVKREGNVVVRRPLKDTNGDD